MLGKYAKQQAYVLAPSQPSQEAAYQDGRQTAPAFGSRLLYACLLPVSGWGPWVCVGPGEWALRIGSLGHNSQHIYIYIYLHTTHDHVYIYIYYRGQPLGFVLEDPNFGGVYLFLENLFLGLIGREM